jgi:hypothetical protein
MRVAICFSGMIRTGGSAFPSIIKYIDKLFSNVDFFLHTWDISQDKEWDLHSLAVLEHGPRPIVAPVKTDKLLNSMINNYGKEFKKIKIEHFDSESLPLPLPMWYSWEQSVKLKYQYERENNFIYDAVVKLRPDLLFKEHKLQYDLNDLEYFKYLGGNSEYMNDVYFISNSQLMDVASNFYTHLMTHKIFPNKSNELSNYLKLKNIKTKSIDSFYPTVDDIPEHRGSCPCTVYREECILQNVSPLEWDKCFNIDNYYYAPK